MPVRLLPSKSLRSAPFPVTAPVVLAVAFDGDPGDPGDLADATFRLHWMPHPALVAWSETTADNVTPDGGTPDRRIPGGAAPNGSDVSEIVVPSMSISVPLNRFAAFCSIAPVVEASGAIAPAPSAQLLAAARRRLERRGFTTVSSRRGVLHAHFHRSAVTVTPWAPFAVPSAPVTIDAASALMRQARERSIPLVDLHRGAAAFRAAEHATVALSCADAPGLGAVYDPDGDVRFADPVELLASCADPDRRVAVHHDVVEAAQVALAGPVGRIGLHPWQDHAVSVLHASSAGAVVALPPGSGKTVVALHALGEMLGPGGFAVALVPVAVATQWAASVEKFAPMLRCTVVRAAHTLDAAFVPSSQPTLVVLSHDLAPALRDFLAARPGARVPVEVLIVDEAHVLGTDSQRSVALDELRGTAPRGWALTGTPDERGEQRLAAVAAWTLARPLTAGALRWRLGPYLITAEIPAPCDVRVRTVAVHAPAPLTAQLAELLGPGVASAFAARGAFEQMRRAASAAKLAWFEERITSGSPRPTLVFTDSLQVGEAVVTIATAAGLRAATLAGANALARTATAAAFVHGELDILVCSSASQRGLDLQRAEEVICLDLPASSGVLAQRVARAVRIGGPAAVEVLLPYLSGSVEAAFMDALAPAVAAIEQHAVPETLVLDNPAAICAALGADHPTRSAATAQKKKPAVKANVTAMPKRAASKNGTATSPAR
jgi:superfamily II DNA or RNA helicase